MSDKTYVQMMMENTYHAELTMIDQYGDNLRHMPIPYTGKNSYRDNANQVIRINAKIPRLSEVIYMGGDFSLSDPDKYAEIYEICTGILNSWLTTIRSGKWRGTIDIVTLEKLDNLAEYVHYFVERLSPVKVEDKPEFMQMAAFSGLLDRNDNLAKPKHIESKDTGYKPKIGDIISSAVSKGIIKA